MLTAHEMPRPRYTAIQWTDHEWNIERSTPPCQNALAGRRERCDAVHEIKFARSNARLQSTPQFDFEGVISERREHRVRCPAFPSPAPQSLGKLVQRSSDALIVDCRKVAPFDQPCPNNRISIADVGDKMHIGNVRHCAGK